MGLSSIYSYELLGLQHSVLANQYDVYLRAGSLFVRPP
jgi:hypothetical protein